MEKKRCGNKAIYYYRTTPYSKSTPVCEFHYRQIKKIMKMVAPGLTFYDVRKRGVICTQKVSMGGINCE